MASVELRDIRKSYGHLQVVQGVDLTIADGEFVALVGPSGCGKSTLLRMVAGLEDITDGSIAIDGQVVNNIPTRLRNIAMVFQSYALYPHMSVFDNMAFSLRLRNMERGRIETGVDGAAGALGIRHLLARHPRQLSGGQRQRVAMGRAIVRTPKVFLFDEPLSNLDAKLRVQMRTEVKSLHQRLGATSIYVTHDQVEAMTMADRIVLLHQGTIAQAGPPLDLYDYPANLIVAGFIGSPSMNFLPGVYRTVAGNGVLAETGLPAPLDIDAYAVAEGREVVLGVRPEHFEILDPGNGITATVHVVEPTGSETIVAAKTAAAELTIVTHKRLALRSGDCIGVMPQRERMHLFDKASGQRLRKISG
ncbi:MAG TPA: sn-glycerol-3-phosphate ABC transporter ATP-binding protein UgpC [Acidisoma sp.]|uniref:ABC transporter ATP-binding protein n=1 Tax=Acidisoma sp. TaxID=1872115 RepID=UPI002C86E3C1|nr:sn-glycerol-3-phosphate ABC transporter ATP-binding protein UgpC [Acidisoma sp.]HTI00087.1 sn-glycerol-3-phosphate ABC transporter ATP-binding protein UgpC [Acidisoma sp.]